MSARTGPRARSLITSRYASAISRSSGFSALDPRLSTLSLRNSTVAISSRCAKPSGGSLAHLGGTSTIQEGNKCAEPTPKNFAHLFGASTIDIRPVGDKPPLPAPRTQLPASLANSAAFAHIALDCRALSQSGTSRRGLYSGVGTLPIKRPSAVGFRLSARHLSSGKEPTADSRQPIRGNHG